MNNTVKAYVLLDVINDIDLVMRLLRIDQKSDQSIEYQALLRSKIKLTNALGDVSVTVEDAA